MNPLDFELLSQVDPQADGHFSWEGCDNPECEAHNIGCTVYDCHGFRTLAEAQSSSRGYYEFDFALCGDCLYVYDYGHRSNN